MPTSQSYSRAGLLTAVVSASLMWGCEGEPQDELVPTPTSSAARLPEDMEALEGAPDCVDLEGSEGLTAVSPEGFAWLAQEHGEGQTRVRVVDPSDLGLTSTHEVDLSSLASARAWSGADASLAADGTVWRLDDFSRVRLTSPVDDLSSASVCGTLDQDGFVLTREGLFERRGSSWWGWDPSLGEDEAPSMILARQGECVGPDQTLWATSEDGVLWGVDIADGSAARRARFGDLIDASATARDVAIIDGAVLWIGSPTELDSWRAWDVGVVGATRLSSNTDSVWIQTEGALLRWSQGEWSALSLPAGQSPTSMLAYESGVWWTTPEQLCHQRVGAGVRVDGFRPFGRTQDESLTLHISVLEGQEAPSVDLGGQPLDALDAQDGGWLVQAPLESLGWHTVSITTAQGTRDLSVERLPLPERSWEQDIQPIYEVNCSECHGGPDALSTDLSTHGAWVQAADRIQAFVVDTQSMPPPASKKDGWSSADVDMIEQWIAGAREP